MDGLLVIDMQNGVCKGQQEVANLDVIVPQLNQTIDEYRKRGLPVIFIQHNDAELVAKTTPWQIISELDAQAEDEYVQKTHANSFYKTNLQAVLVDKNIHTLEVAGAQVEYCVDTTVKMAHGLGYQLQMQSGLVTTVDNAWMSAQQTIDFYEHIWQDRFLKLI